MSRLLDQTVEQDLGVDLLSTPASDRVRSPGAGDLRSNKTGDLTTDSGLQLVIRGRLRELTTPIGQYARYIDDVDGLKLIDIEYGNEAFRYLSEPTNTLPLDRIIESCRTVMLKDIRVESANVSPTLDPNTGMLNIKINFTIISGNVGSISFALNPIKV
jgi:hypothetical protein